MNRPLSHMIRRGVLVAAAVLALAACTERPQTQTNDQRKSPVAEFHGTSGAFAAPGWTAGDQTSWENHLRVRTQRGQNEYVRIGQ